jgi:hypothetical protein
VPGTGAEVVVPGAGAEVVVEGAGAEVVGLGVDVEVVFSPQPVNIKENTTIKISGTNQSFFIAYFLDLPFQKIFGNPGVPVYYFKLHLLLSSSLFSINSIII